MADTTFDLSTNSQVPLSVIASDTNGNVLTGVPTVFSVPDSTVVTLTDNGDGTATAVRVSKDAGSVVITATTTNADGTTAVGTLTLSTAAQVPPVVDVTSVEIVPGVAS